MTLLYLVRHGQTEWNALDAAAGADGKDVMIVSHGSALRTLVYSLLGLTETVRVLSGLDNVHWSLLTSKPDGGWSLARHNVGGD